MYLRLFNPAQREAFCRVAQWLLHLDGLSEAEVALLDNVRTEVGLEKLPPAAKQEELPELAKAFDSTPAKMVALIEAAGLVAADGQVTVSERGEVMRLGGALGVPSAQVERCFAYIDRIRVMHQEGLALISGRA